MRSLKWLAPAMLLAALVLVSGASAQVCTDGLFDTLGPTLGTYEVGETIEYVITISIPASPDPPTYCTLIDMDVYFFPPPGELAGACDNPALGVYIGTIAELAPGDPAVVYTSADNAALAYLVPASAAGGQVRADMGVTFYVQGDITGTLQCDEKTSTNTILCPAPCLEIEKVVDCDISKVTDQVMYTIRIKNCGDYALTDVVVTDPHISADPLVGFPTTLPADDTWYPVDFPYTVQPDDEDPNVDYPDDIMRNQATVTGVDACDGETRETVLSNFVDVKLVDPSYTVDVTCRGGADIGADATFDIRIDNTGDVPLVITDLAGEITPGEIAVGDFFTDEVTRGPMVCPEICYDLVTEGRIASGYCDLPNVIPGGDGACCPCICTPCILIEKVVDCDVSKVTDQVMYTIRIKNCGDIPLTNVVVTDSHISADPLVGFLATLPADDTWYPVDFPYTVQPDDEDPNVDYPDDIMSNTAYVIADWSCGDATGTTDATSAQVDVKLIDPSYTVDVTCRGGADIGADATFDIRIDNTGDVPLVITDLAGEITPGEIAVGDFFTDEVTRGPMVCPEICYDLVTEGRISSGYCDLPNVIPGGDGACCPCICTPCILIEKVVDCDVSKVTDQVMYTIRIKNCGDIPLTNVVVTDSHISADPLVGFLATLPADDTWYPVDFPYTVQPDDEDPNVDYPDDIMSNTAYVIADWSCGDATGTTDATSAQVDVKLVDPSYTVDVTCRGGADIGADATFDIRIDNTGDVPLVITDLAGEITPGEIAVGDFFTDEVTRGPMVCPEICYDLVTEGRISSGYCDLPNVIPGGDGACCPCICTPCILIEKVVDCDVSKVTDQVMYTIRIKNCGDIPLTNVVVTDSHISADPLVGFLATLPADDTWYPVDFPYTVQPDDEDPNVDYPDDIMSNTAYVIADWSCGDATGTTDATSAQVDVKLIDPDFTVEKVCVESPIPSGATEAWYTVTITNTGDVPLDFTTDDAAILPFTLLPTDAPYEQQVSEPVPAGVPEVCNTIRVDWAIPGDAEWCGLTNTGFDTAEACCQITGAHGCTPGYWKNQTECWECYTTSTLICDVFTFPAGPLYGFFCDGDVTLHKALKFGGGEGVVGKARNLMRHGVAALLNACDQDVNYGMDPAAVIAMVNAALATEDETEITSVQGVLAGWNERGCSQDAHCRPQDPELDGPGGAPARITPTDVPGDGLDESRNPGSEGILQSEMTVPREFSVRGVPNPAGTSSSIRYALPMDSKVTVEILDIQGRLVTKLLDQHMPAGSHMVAWDGDGSPAGVYFCRVQCCDGKETVSKVIKVQ